MATCPTCGHVKRAARTIKATGHEFPAVTPTEGAVALHADHVARRDGLAVTRGHLLPRAIVRRKPGKREHPDDKAMRTGRPDLVRFLRECTAGGHVARFYAAETPGMVRIWFAGPRGVFRPCEPVELTYHEIEALAFRIAHGTAHELYPARLALVS